MLYDIRDHVLSQAEEMAARGDSEALLALIKALADELVRVTRVAEQRILTEWAEPTEPPQVKTWARMWRFRSKGR